MSYKANAGVFENCFGLSHLVDILDKNGRFLDPDGSGQAVTPRGWVTLEGQA